MDVNVRELLVARICSGSVRIQVTWPSGRPRTYLMCRPSRDQMYVAHGVYEEQFYAAQLEGLFCEEDLYEYLLEHELWDESRQLLLEKLPKEIEEFKVKLYKANFRSEERKVVRAALTIAKNKLAEVMHERHEHDHLSCSGYASLARTRYLAGCSLRDLARRPVFPDETFWEEPSGMLDVVLSAYAQLRLDEATFRELARTEPWRSLWSCRKAENGVFGIPAADYTEEQRTLTAFSCLYDSVHEHPDCPAEEVICDDDMLDGWLIDQRRQREKRLGSKAGEELIGNERIRGAQEVYLVADTAEDAGRVMDLNDEHARAVQRRRFSYLRDKGEVNELEMPDTRQRLRMEATQMLSQSMKG